MIVNLQMQNEALEAPTFSTRILFNKRRWTRHNVTKLVIDGVVNSRHAGNCGVGDSNGTSSVVFSHFFMSMVPVLRVCRFSELVGTSTISSSSYSSS